MRTLFTLALLIASTTAHADEFIVHTGSVHTKSSYVNAEGESVKFNNANVGVGYRFDNGIAVGTYYNSYRQPTAYIVGELDLTVRFKLQFGVATGYKIVNGKDVTEIGALNFRQPLTKNVTLDVLAVPPIKDLAGVVHVAISYKR